MRAALIAMPRCQRSGETGGRGRHHQLTILCLMSHIPQHHITNTRRLGPGENKRGKTFDSYINIGSSQGRFPMHQREYIQRR